MSEPFDFDRFLSLPRLSGLRLSPDGRRLVVAVARPDPEGHAMRTALWQVDPEGARPPRRITRSSAGESVACFARDGALLFTSSRPDPDEKPDPDKKISALWRLPAEGGEAELIAAPEGGVDGVAAARDGDAVAFGAYLHPGSDSIEADAEKAKARKEAGVGALLFEDYPIRHWDDWLGPRRRRLFAAALSPDREARPEPKDLTGDAGPAFVETGFDISPDGRTVVAAWADFSQPPRMYVDLVAIDVESGERRKLTEGDAEYADPKISPDGRWVAAVRGTLGDTEHPIRLTLELIDLASGQRRQLAAELDAWPESPVWLRDSSGLLFNAEWMGHHAAFRVDLEGGAATCLVADTSVGDLCPAPDGRTVYALASTVLTPPRIVSFDAHAESQTPRELPNSIDDGSFRFDARLEHLCARAADGTEIWSWLILPPDASAEHPAPLVVWVHGGPLGSWDASWHWRWNAALLVARGYAILAPDPALSLGYGQRMVDRGWGRWGGEPYEDIMAATDGALERPDLDASRTALMGGSYGGYMANWVAGHTDRFGCIVTHASVWDPYGDYGVTDTGWLWEQEMGDPFTQRELWDKWSPRQHVSRVKTPMLVIHGERDFRVPLSNALEMWTELRRFGVPARFLYFPDENHWILKPQNARLWYETVLAFLDEHLLGKEWVRPTLL